MSYDWTSQIETFLKGFDSPVILDAGCGVGRDIEEFRKRGVHIDGIDFSAQAIGRLHEKFPDGKFLEADIKATGLEDEAYSGIWACASILNLKKEDVPVALAEFRRLLKSNGRLFISVKKGEGERMVPDKAGERLFSFFSEKELQGLVENAGFSIENIEVVEDNKFTGKNTQPAPPSWICLYAKKRE
jgi:SAM-dependent methyltransferase